MGRELLIFLCAFALCGCAKKPSDADILLERFTSYVRCTQDAAYSIDVRKNLQNCLYTNGLSDSSVAYSPNEQGLLDFAKEY